MKEILYLSKKLRANATSRVRYRYWRNLSIIESTDSSSRQLHNSLIRPNICPSEFPSFKQGLINPTASFFPGALTAGASSCRKSHLTNVYLHNPHSKYEPYRMKTSEQKMGARPVHSYARIGDAYRHDLWHFFSTERSIAVFVAKHFFQSDISMRRHIAIPSRACSARGAFALRSVINLRMNLERKIKFRIRR